MYGLFKRFGIFFLIIVLSGCYGSNHLMMEFDLQPAYNKDSVRIAYAVHSKIFKPAMGLARFPDGGMSKIIYSDLIICLYDLESKSLQVIYNYGNLPYPGRTAWHCNLKFINDSLYFSISPSGGWESALNTKPMIDTSLCEKVSGWFIYDLGNNKISMTQSAETVPFNSTPLKNGDLAEYVKKFEWADYGINLSEILPESKKNLLDDLEKLEGNKEYREVIIQQLVSELDHNQIQLIIQNIEKNYAGFSEKERQKKRFAKEEALEMLYTILN